MCGKKTIRSLACALLIAMILAVVPGNVTEGDFVFGQPVNLGAPVNTPSADGSPSISPDGLEMYFFSDRAGGYGKPDIWVSKRASLDDGWGEPVNAGPQVNSGSWEDAASLSADGLTLYFASNRPGGAGRMDLYMTTRTTKDTPWGPAVHLGPLVNSAEIDDMVKLSVDGLELYFDSNRAGGFGNLDLWVSTRPSVEDPWGPSVNLGATVNTPGADVMGCLSPDGLRLFYSSDRSGGFGNYDVWMATRPFKGAPWNTPVNLGPSVNTSTCEWVCGISPNGRWLYFDDDAQARPGTLGTSDIFQVPIMPTLDFNGDGKVDGKEVWAVADHLGQNKSLYDIGLQPMGDGVVDANDLKVLAAYIGQEVNDPTLLAHWALDETAGMTAGDSAGDNDAMVLGNAAWQADGKISGALAFDGKDDFARSGKSVLDPAQGPFSVIAWVKGGDANRVIVSQSTGADWLYLNQYGILTTDLKSSGKDGKSLTSDAYVLDDQWHRVVLTWDGTNRTLQMDGVEVARGMQPNLAASNGNVQIGVGKTMTPASFWTGLIDDVRVYNRAVAP